MKGFQVNNKVCTKLAICVLCCSMFATGYGQSSSLFVTGGENQGGNASQGTATGAAGGNGRAGGTLLSEAVASVSLAAVKPPEPRRFALQDLVTIIVRESTESDSSSKLDTKKDTTIDGEVSNWPGIRVLDMLTDQILKQNLSENPKLGLKFKNEFKGDGGYTRRDSMTTRVTARIIDIKPNGTLVLEARKFIQSDEESLEVVMTGVCRREDVSADNTIESTRLYDLRLTKSHGGELFKTTDKGVITKFFEMLFNF